MGTTDTSPPGVELLDASSCAMGEPNAMWAWVSDTQIINQGNDQCLAVDSTSLVTAECDAKNGQTLINFDRDSNVLTVAGSYLDSSSGELSGSETDNNEWMAEVEDGMAVDLSMTKGLLSFFSAIITFLLSISVP